MSEEQKDFDWIDVADLQPWIKNPRFNDAAVIPVANSIEEFGFGAPIVVQAGTFMIIAGHTRLKAAMRLGWKKVPCRILEISDRNAERLAIADNKTNEIAQWNEDQLNDILQGFEPEELDNLGFNEEELKNLLNDTDSESESEEVLPPPPPPVNTNQTFRLLKGDCLERLKELEDGSVDSIVTDPPYMINFMNHGWDHEDRDVVDNVELWQECLRVLKAGGHLVSFCATRTIHRMTTVIEQAGFEIRDQICWAYESGFPKSFDISKGIDKKLGVEDQRKKVGTKFSGIANKEEKNRHTIGASKAVEVDITMPASEEAQKWSGWGTALKPAFEPAVLARKPIDKSCGSVVENVLKFGTGAINIDASRFAYGDDCWFGSGHDCSNQWDTPTIGSTQAFKYGEHGKRDLSLKNDISSYKPVGGRWPANIYRCKKPHRNEKEAGLDHLQGKVHDEDGAGYHSTWEQTETKNFHPTVKPIKLMRWLCGLVTPVNGTVLDPFLGSGTTAAAAMLEGFNAIGCEITEDYWPIIEGRVENAKREYIQGESNGTKDEN